jgi:hypothetical protein
MRTCTNRPTVGCVVLTVLHVRGRRLVLGNDDTTMQVLAKLSEHAAIEEAMITAFGGGKGGAVLRVDATLDAASVCEQLVGMFKLRR